MAGFLIAAISIPHAFDGTGIIFGAGYLAAIAVLATTPIATAASAGLHLVSVLAVVVVMLVLERHTHGDAARS